MVISGNNNIAVTFYSCTSCTVGNITHGSSASSASDSSASGSSASGSSASGSSASGSSVNSALLQYNSEAFDLLRNNSVVFSTIASESYSNDFNLNNAIVETDYTKQWSTKSLGEGLSLLINFNDPVAISSMVLRQRMMNNDSSLLKKAKVTIGRIEKIVDFTNTEDSILSSVYKEFYASNSDNTWGLQEAVTVNYERAILTKTIKIEGVELMSQMDEFKNTGLADIQIYGAKLNSVEQASLNILMNEDASLNSWPMNTYTGSSPLTLFTYQDETVGAKRQDADPSGIAPRKVAPPAFEVCNSLRNWVVASFGGILDYPGGPLDISFVTDVSNGTKTFSTEFEVFKNNITANDLSGIDLSMAVVMSDLTELLTLILQTEVIYYNGNSGTAGSKWIGSTLLDIGSPLNKNPLIEIGKLVAEWDSYVTDMSSNSNVIKFNNNQQSLSYSFPNLSSWVPMIAAMHVSQAISLAPNTGLTQNALDTLQNPLVNTNQFNEFSSDIQYTAAKSTTNNLKSQIDKSYWLGGIGIEAYEICSTASALRQYMSNIDFGKVKLDKSNFGLMILQKISELLVVEKEMIYDGISANNTSYLHSPEKFFNDSLYINIHLYNMSEKNTIGDSGATVITKQQEAQILWYLTYIYVLHLKYIANHTGLDYYLSFGGSLATPSYSAISTAMSETTDLSKNAALTAAHPTLSNSEFIGPNSRSIKSGIYLHVDDSMLTENVGYDGNTYVGLQNFYTANANYVDPS